MGRLLPLIGRLPRLIGQLLPLIGRLPRLIGQLPRSIGCFSLSNHTTAFIMANSIPHTVSSLPDWIDERIDRNLDNTLTQTHVVETMLAADRPFFSIRQLQARIKPDVSTATVRNRLTELQAIDVVATETYPESITLYYINHPDTEWPLSPTGKRALETESPLDRLSTRGFLTMRDTAGVRTLALAGLQLTLLLLALGAILTIAGLDVESTTSDIILWGTAFDLLFVSLAVLAIERFVRWLRRRSASNALIPIL